MNNEPLNRDLNDKILIFYLEKIVDKLKRKEISDNDLEKIYKIIFENASNCDLDLSDNDSKDTLSYIFLGWYLNENLKDNNLFSNDKDVNID
jgi:hypothetical protein